MASQHQALDRLSGKKHSELFLNLKSGQFKNVISTLQSKLDLGREERYALGFAFLRTQALSNTLKCWAPLVGKMEPQFDIDCKTVLIELFGTETWQSDGWKNMPIEEITRVFLVARTLLGDHPMTSRVRKYVFNVLWNQSDEVSLKSLLDLMSSKKERTDISNFMNLVKVRFLLKMHLKDPIIFSNQFLTAVSTYAVKYGDSSTFSESIKGLSNLLINQISDFDVKHLIALQTQIVVNSIHAIGFLNAQETALIPAPLFYCSLEKNSPYVTMANSFVQQLPDLMRTLFSEEGSLTLKLQAGLVNKHEASKLYQIKKSTGVLTYTKTLDYSLKLRLGIAALKAEDSIGLEILKEIMGNVESLRLDLNQLFPMLLKNDYGEHSISQLRGLNLVLEAITTIIPTFIWDKANKNKIFLHLIQLCEDHRLSKKEWVSFLNQAEKFADHPDQKSHIKSILDRLAEVEGFLSTLSLGTTKKVYKNLWSRKASSDDLKSFLLLVADAARLTYKWHPFWVNTKFFDDKETTSGLIRILDEIFENKRLNTLAQSLEGEWTEYFDCLCHRCCENLLLSGVPAVLKSMGVELFQLKNVDMGIESPTSRQIQHQDGLNSLDPFKVLNVDRDTTKAEILKRTMELMRQNPAKMSEYRSAQSALFDPSQKACHGFLKYLEPPSESSFESEYIANHKSTSTSKIDLLEKWRTSAKH